MKRGKKLHAISYGALIFFLAILIGVVIYQQNLLETGPQSTKVEDLKKSNSEAVVDNSFGRPEDSRNANIASNEINELEYQLRASEEELDETRNELIKEQDKNQELYDRSHTPEALSQRRRMIEESVSNTFGPMLNNLGIYGEKRSKLNDLLAERMLAHIEISQKMAGQEIKAEDRDRMRQQYGEIDNEIAEKISELFGEEIKFDVISSFSKEGEMQIAGEFADFLGEDDTMTDKQHEELVDAMYEVGAKIIQNINQGTSMSELSDEDIEKLKDFPDQIDEAYLSSAKTILSKSQYTQFQYYFKLRKRSMEQDPQEVND